MIINLEQLPKDIYNQIPISIKTFKSEYNLDDLPFEFQSLIKEYLDKKIEYDSPVYDVKPIISEYGDLTIINNLFDLIHEYINNYFETDLGNYPYNCVIGTSLKRTLQKKDTVVQNLLMHEEMDRMINTFTQSNKDFKIKLNKYNLDKKKINNSVEYNLSIDIEINDEGKNLVVSFIV